MISSFAVSYGVRQAVSGGPIAPRTLAYFRALGGQGLSIWEVIDAAEEHAWVDGLHMRSDWFAEGCAILREHHKRGAREALRRSARRAAAGRNFRDALHELTLDVAELADDEDLIEATCGAFAERGVHVIADPWTTSRAIRNARHAYASACA